MTPRRRALLTVMLGLLALLFVAVLKYQPWREAAEVPSAPIAPRAGPGVVDTPAGFASDVPVAASELPRSFPAEGAIPEPIVEPTALGLRISRALSAEGDPAARRAAELIVLFDSDAPYQRASSLALRPGLEITGRIPEIHALRLRVEVAAELEAMLEADAPFLVELSPNWRMHFTLSEAREPGGALVNLPVRALVGSSAAQPMRRVTIASLDSGVIVGAPAFAGSSQPLEAIDAGWGTVPADDHGMGMAELVRRVSNDARIVGVRVTDIDGSSDLFSVAQGIVLAANARADLIAVSPASPVASATLSRAVGYADERGLAVLASTAGDPRSWPAADPRVIAVDSIVTRRARVDANPLTPVTYQPADPMPEILLNQVRLDSAASTAIAAAALAVVMNAHPGTTSENAWSALLRMSNSSSLARGDEAQALYDSGFQALNLSWIGRGGPAATGVANAERPSPAPGTTRSSSNGSASRNPPPIATNRIPNAQPSASIPARGAAAARADRSPTQAPPASIPGRGTPAARGPVIARDSR